VYLVGGAVRNLLLGKPVKDFDFTTDALPSEVQGYFRKVLPTGLQHGTVTVVFQGEAYEVTTFRVDGAYADGRRPSEVTFTPSLEEDLKRRDFTVNAVALNLIDGTLVDPHGGQVDLRRGLLRAIGDPGQRFDEDALRLLRLFRFVAQLGFSIDPPTLEAVPPRRPRLAAVSQERIREELTKTLGAPYPDRAWVPLQDLGFLGDLLAPVPVASLDPGVLKRLADLPPSLRWSWWLTLAGGPDRTLWDRALRRLTMSNADREAILAPPKALDLLSPQVPPTQGAKALIEAWGDRAKVRLGVLYLEALEAHQGWKDTHGWKAELVRAAESGEPIFLQELAVGGAQLMAEGVRPGPDVGRILKALQREVWAAPHLNSIEALVPRIQALR